MNILDFAKRKSEKRKVSMLTCYDYSFARLIEQSKVDCILVGDSAAMVMHGHPTTIPMDVETMSLHVAAVVRGAPSKFIIGDLPFLAHRKGLKSTMESVDQIMKAGAHSVKIEGVTGHEKVIKHIVESGVPVMGHIGLTPQSVHQLGGYKVQGKGDAGANHLISQAHTLQELGCFSVVLECVPSNLATQLTAELDIPTIGIGAGSSTDGQVLVLQDMLGLNTDFKPKFVRRFANLDESVLKAVNEFHDEIENVTFPGDKESFTS